MNIIPKKRTHEEFVNILKNKNPNINVVGNYTQAHTKIQVNCKICGHIWNPTANSLIRGFGCPKCADIANGERRNLTHEQFLSKIDEQTLKEYIFIDKYKNSSNYMKIKHLTCDETFQMTPNVFLRGERCPHCFSNIRKTTDEFANYVNNQTNGEYSLVSDYKNAHTYVDILHVVCGNTYPVKPNNFTNGKRCPFCNESKGETAIRLYLEKDNIPFIPQYRFPDCKNILPLPFDFAIFENEEKTKLRMLIEYDGEFHYGIGRRVPTEQAYKILKRTHFHDNIKNDYCNKNKIKLIRIPYWELKNINQILKTQLDKEEVIK